MSLKPLSPEQEARGITAEARFFYFADPDICRLRGYEQIKQAPPLLDVRGIDGFLFHHRGSSVSIRVPFQLKTGFKRNEHERMHQCGVMIPVIPINVNMRCQQYIDKIRILLDACERRPFDYEPFLARIDNGHPSPAEQALVGLIVQHRRTHETNGVSVYAPS